MFVKLHPALCDNMNVFVGCQDMCQIQETISCQNNGRCKNNYIDTGCDCRGSGFTRRHAQNVFMLFFNFIFSSFILLNFTPRKTGKRNVGIASIRKITEIVSTVRQAIPF